MKIALIVEYDGARYCGFQYQVGVPTVQGEIEGAIRKLTGERRRVLAASRTDAGVHALGQVVSFNTESKYEESVFVRALNFHLPEDIAVRAAYRISDQFNVQRRAVSREYRYLIINSRTRSPLWKGRACQVPLSLDAEAMNRACRNLLGEHDFTSFVTHYEKGTTRRTVLEAAVSRIGEMVTFRVTANAFLAHQVRNTIGALVQIGLGKEDTRHIRDLISRKTFGLAGPTAGPEGLYLVKVNYAQALGAIE